MVTNGKKENCGFADEIVSYIYDESGEPERRKFETHLIDCSVCTDEFAAISNARFSVFEWQKEEFADLTTPDIVIPYAPKRPTVANENAAVGFFAGLRGLLSFPTLPVAVAAVLVVCLGVGLVAVNYVNDNVEQVFEVIAPPAEPQIERAAAPPENPSTESEKRREIVASTTASTKSNSPDTKPLKVIAKNRRPRIEKPLTANNTKKLVNDLAVQKQAQQARKAPVLSETEETDDRSLRLADLFDGDGGR